METKKSPNANLEKRRPLFLAAGTILALSFSLVAFEYRTPYEKPYIPEPSGGELIDISDIIAIKIEDDKPKPEEKKVEKQKSQEIKIVDKLDIQKEKPDDEKPVEKVDLESLANALFTVGDNIGDEKPEEIEPPVRFPDKMPVFKCMNDSKAAEEDLLNFIASRLKYPQRAIEMGVEGKVYVEFVVDKTGKVKDIKVLKGIGYGCDDEVVRVLKMLPDWCPGYLNGKYCDVFYNLPVKFALP